RALGTSPALPPRRRLARAERGLARRPGGRDPGRRRPARERQDDPAALPVRPGPRAQRRGLVQQRARAHARPGGPGEAAPGPLRLDRPLPRARPRAERVGERRPAADAARRRPAPRQDRRPGMAGAPRRRRQVPPAPRGAGARRTAAGLHRPRPRPGPHRAVRRRADRPAAPRRPPPRAAHPDHGRPLARHHRGPGDVRPGHRGPRRPHGVPARRAARAHRAPAAGLRHHRGGRPGRVLALRLTRGARPAVHLRRLLVTTASAGTGFLLLCALGHALGGTAEPPASALRLAWCAAPLAATVYLAIAVARTDPATRPRPGLSAVGLGPARLMLGSATTTAPACPLGATVALLVFLHLRGHLTGLPFDGDGTDFLAAGQPLPVPATLTLLALVPLTASASVATALRPREARPPATGPGARGFGRFGAYARTAEKETFGAYARFGKHLASAGRPRRPPGAEHAAGGTATATVAAAGAPAGTVGTAGAPAGAAGAAVGTAEASGAGGDAGATPTTVAPVTPLAAPSGLPWGIAVLAMGLAVEALTSPSGTG